MARGYGYFQWAPYVPVAQRRAKAAAFAERLAKQEKRRLEPVKIAGRKIATTFWGQGWCDNLERYSDFENRLPRGRTYARNGSVIDLNIQRGEIKAIVSGSEVYRVSVSIKTLPAAEWKRICADCSESVESVIDLLRGRFDKAVMERLMRIDGGLFPQPSQIEMKCSCPDWSVLCKHVAAALYGVGARLDSAPEMLFALRGVDHVELASHAIAAGNVERALAADRDDSLAGTDLGDIFGIDLESSESPKPKGRVKAPPATNVKAAIAKPAKVKAAKLKAADATPAKVRAAIAKLAQLKPASVKPASVKAGSASRGRTKPASLAVAAASARTPTKKAARTRTGRQKVES